MVEQQDNKLLRVRILKMLASKLLSFETKVQEFLIRECKGINSKRVS